MTVQAWIVWFFGCVIGAGIAQLIIWPLYVVADLWNGRGLSWFHVLLPIGAVAAVGIGVSGWVASLLWLNGYWA